MYSQQITKTINYGYRKGRYFTGKGLVCHQKSIKLIDRRLDSVTSNNPEVFVVKNNEANEVSSCVGCEIGAEVQWHRPDCRFLSRRDEDVL